MESSWAALFSGGKDSSWALVRAMESGKRVVRTVTARPRGDSYLFHTPATDVAALLAESAGIDHHAFPVDDPADGGPRDSTTAGDAELEALADALVAIDAELEGGLDGLVVGAVESRYQRDRVDRLCNRYGFDLAAPLWGCDPRDELEAMLEAGFDIRVVAVAAAGLDEAWLGRRLDAAAIEALLELQDSHGVHPMGEGGEYETLVVDGPHLARPLRFEATSRWDGVRGHLAIEDAWLAPTPNRS